MTSTAFAQARLSLAKVYSGLLALFMQYSVVKTYLTMSR
jgi:hypothetical protein